MIDAFRIVFFADAGDARRADLLLQSKEVRIGRHDPASHEPGPEIDMLTDMMCSRQHARFWNENGVWRIEDSGSRHGTRVADSEIRGQGPIELQTSTLITTGQTTWTVLPADQWYSIAGSIFVSADLADLINYASYHSGTPLIREFRAANINTERSAMVTVGIDIPGYSALCKFDVPPLESQETRIVKLPSFAMDGTALRAQIEPTKTQWRVEIELQAPRKFIPDSAGVASTSVPSERAEGTRRIYSAHKELTMLGYWDWSFAPSARKTIAVFSTPRNPAIERAVQESQRYAVHDTLPLTYRDLLRSSVALSERLILKSIYLHLQQDWDLHYEEPKSIGAKAEHFQTIRSAHRILPAGVPRIASATCIDLALVFAACLENIGLCPLIVFLGQRGKPPRHAMVAVWSGSTAGPYPVCEDAEFIRAECAAGRLFVVECTAVTSGAFRTLDKPTFEQAEMIAIRGLQEADWISAVDIMNLRPPAGRIMPLENPFEPEVARLFDTARQIAVSTRARNVETVHLLYAAILGEGVTARIIDRMNVDRDHVRREMGIPPEISSETGYPAPTANVVECRQLAHSFARQQESPSVREQDLLWALLQKAPHSIRMVEACLKMHFDLELFRQYLTEVYPSPLLDSTSTYTSLLVHKP